MPERQDDHQAYWEYLTSYPGADFKQNQIGVRHPYLVEATGTDGRFIGAIRPFPGMADATVHGVPRPEAGQTITSISNVVFAKYVSIQKGITRHTLKGIAYIADNQAGTGSAIYFAYRDSEDGTDDVVMLEDFKSWTDFTLDTLTEYDITSNGKYIYFVCSGDTSSTPLTKFNTKEPPYNKAYFYDWKINDWDAFNRNGTGFEGRFMSIFPTRFLEGALNEDTQPELASGTQGATTASNTTIDLTGDSPVDLSNVVGTDKIVLNGVTLGMAWTESLIVSTVDDANDTLTVTVAPQATATGVLWSIQDASSLSSDNVMDVQLSAQNGFVLPKGNYTGAVELVSRKHNLRSYIRYDNYYAAALPDSSLRYWLTYVKLPIQVDGVSGQTNQLRGDAINGTCALYWGIPHCDGYRFWRSQGDGATSSGNRSKYSLISQLYLVDSYKEKRFYLPSSALFIPVFVHVPDYVTVPDPKVRVTYVDDTGLVEQIPFDALDESFGAMPRAKLIASYAGLVVGVTDVAEPAVFDGEGDWSKADQRTEELFWSHTGKLEPENFPPENRYSPDDPSEKFLALEPAGDHLFAISTSSVYKLSRSGSTLALNRILSRLGGISRNAATGVGNTLFLVTKAGVKSIDGNTGAIKSISAMDRIIFDDSEWAGSLGNIHLQYDATMGVLVFLNTTKKECFLLWEATGAVIRLVDCPWTFLVGGNDVLTNGSQRAYFIQSDGMVHCIDGARTMGKRSMCGATNSETVNGTCTTASATQIIDSGATFPANCVGHQVYIHNGNMEGNKVTVTTRVSATTLTVSGLSETTATTTRYSVAPIVTELVFKQLGGQGGDAERDPVDPFSRKIVTSMTAAFSDLGGETGSGDTNPYIRMGMWRNRQRLAEIEKAMNILPDQMVARVSGADVRVYPSLRFFGGNLDFELQALLVHGSKSSSEAQSRQA